MITQEQLYKIVEMSIETNFNGLFGGSENECGEPYEEIYSSELYGIYEHISNFLYNLADVEEFVITTEQLSGVLLFRWSQTFGVNCTNIGVYRKIAEMILVTIDRVNENPRYI